MRDSREKQTPKENWQEEREEERRKKTLGEERDHEAGAVIVRSPEILKCPSSGLDH